MSTFGDRLTHAWNVLNGKGADSVTNYGSPVYNKPESVRASTGYDRSIISTIYTRLAVDAASVSIKHVRLDDDERYIKTEDSSLNECLTVSANKDQTGRAFLQDLFFSLLTNGVVAVVPVDYSIKPSTSSSLTFNSLRVGRIKQWYPDYVRVEIYDDRSGRRQEVTLPKSFVAIITNPFYAIMNEPNSVAKSLAKTLSLLDVADESNNSGKLDLIIQLPYIIKTEARKQQAEERRKAIENQLAGSKYGIAYTDGTEKIMQLNRPIENKLLEKAKYLTSTLMSQLGLSPAIFDGTADEKVVLNYQNGTIEPLLAAVVEEFKRKFLTKTARSQGQSIIYFREPFRFTPITQLADLLDKLTRNEIITGNEARQICGFKPSADPNAEQLRNKNLYPAEPMTPIDSGGMYPEDSGGTGYSDIPMEGEY